MLIDGKLEIKSNIKPLKSLNNKIHYGEFGDESTRENVLFLLSLLNSIHSKNLILKPLLIVFIYLTTGNLNGQCTSPPAISNCNPLGSQILANNDNVNIGQIKTVNGTSSFIGLCVNGGTLVICGNLTVTSFTFNSGTIIINPGGVLNINSGLASVFGNNCIIYNYGTFNTTSSIVTGQNNLIVNCVSTSFFNVLFNQIVVQGPGTQVINNGIINAGFFIVSANNGPNPICSGMGSCINTSILINQTINSFNSPSGPSCIYIASQVINSQSITTSSNVNVCYLAANVSIIGAPNFGSATVNSNCPNCGVALPIELVSFTGRCENTGIIIEWSTTSERDLKYQAVQVSEDGINFDDICVKYSYGNSNYFKNYTFEYFNQKWVNTYYFRLHVVNNDGSFFDAPIIAVQCDNKVELEVYNDNMGHLMIISNVGLVSVLVVDVLGRIIKQVDCSNKEIVDFNINVEYSKAPYFLRILDVRGRLTDRKIVNLGSSD